MATRKPEDKKAPQRSARGIEPVDARRLVAGFGGPRRSNLKEDAASYLREAILTGQLRPGERVDQDAVAEVLGVSRLPVREAIIELAQEGLVASLPRRGAYVAEFERDDVIDHYRIYGLVSGVAAERAAIRLTDDELGQLREIHGRLTESRDSREQEQLNFEFHRLINLSGGNLRLRSVIRLLSRSLPMHYFEFAPRWVTTARHQHLEILDALVARDPDGARTAMETHLRESGTQAVTILDSIGFWGSATKGRSGRNTD